MLDKMQLSSFTQGCSPAHPGPVHVSKRWFYSRGHCYLCRFKVQVFLNILNDTFYSVVQENQSENTRLEGVSRIIWSNLSCKSTV